MDTVGVIEETIKGHPRIDFDNGPGITTEYWALCPCGYSTRHYRSPKTAAKAFQTHVAEEVNEALLGELERQKATVISPKVPNATVTQSHAYA